MNILVISHNQKGWTYETLYNEHQQLIKKGKLKYFFWGPGYAKLFSNPLLLPEGGREVRCSS